MSEVLRSDLVGVQIVTNRNGHYVNMFINGVPHRTEKTAERLTIPEALQYLAVLVRMDENNL